MQDLINKMNYVGCIHAENAKLSIRKAYCEVARARKKIKNYSEDIGQDVILALAIMYYEEIDGESQD